MLKSLRLGAALITVLATQISTEFLTSPASAANTATLNAQLKQAICTQNWGEAVKIVDQMIAITPSSNQTQHDELKMQRGRMHNLSVSRTNVDSWLENYCGTPGSTPAATRQTAISSTTALAPTNLVLGQSYEAIESYFGSPLRKTKNRYSYSAVGLWKFFPQASSAFVVNFTSGQAKSITLHFDKDVQYGRKQASQFFEYVFGYQPPSWQLFSSTPLGEYRTQSYANIYVYCMDVGVATEFMRVGKEIYLGDGKSMWTKDTNAVSLRSEPRCQ